MSRPLRYRHRQRGVAVITALLLTTLAITIVASLFWQQQVQVRSIENQRLQLQKQWVLRGALDWARLILREDAKYSSVDHLGEPWSVELAETRLDQYVENERVEGDIADAALSGHIVDAQSRFNLTNLASNGTVDPAQVAAFQRLLSSLQLTPGLAEATAETLAAGQSKTPQQSGGGAGRKRRRVVGAEDARHHAGRRFAGGARLYAGRVCEAQGLRHRAAAYDAGQCEYGVGGSAGGDN